MKVVINKQPEKYMATLNVSDKGRIAEAIDKLELEPPEGDIEKLRGKKEKAYRLRVGDWRILYKVKETYIAVYKIAPRGQAYNKE